MPRCLKRVLVEVLFAGFEFLALTTAFELLVSLAYFLFLEFLEFLLLIFLEFLDFL